MGKIKILKAYKENECLHLECKNMTTGDTQLFVISKDSPLNVDEVTPELEKYIKASFKKISTNKPKLEGKEIDT